MTQSVVLGSVHVTSLENVSHFVKKNNSICNENRPNILRHS